VSGPILPSGYLATPRGVEGIYDRHGYREEKAHALKALAGLIENILAPQGAKVTRLHG
jgi:hypothetical protein